MDLTSAAAWPRVANGAPPVGAHRLRPLVITDRRDSPTPDHGASATSPPARADRLDSPTTAHGAPTTSPRARAPRPTLAPLVTTLLLLAFTLPARAQSYAFSVPAVLMECFVEPDGKATIDYTFEIENAPDAKPLDGVDVGMPTTSWSLSDCRGWQDGESRPVESSPYVQNAAAVDLAGDHAIPPGSKSEVRFVATGVGDLLSTDPSNPGYASFRITPTWFGSEFVRGETRVRVVVHLPPGVPADQLKWHREPWVGQVQVEATPERQEHAAVVFERTYAFTGAWPNGGTVGVSFPMAAPGGTGAPLVRNVRRITTWDLFVAWASQGPVRARTVFAFLGVFSLAFFWATRRTGCAVWGCSCIGLLVLFAASPVAPWVLTPVLIAAIVIIWFLRKSEKRRYVPAVASVEGGGIKRGLTAPEAACLLEAPPEKILLLALYGMARKGLIRLETVDKKLKGTVATGFGVTPAEDVRLAAEKGIVVHPYESAFLANLGPNVPHAIEDLKWRPALEGLAKHAASRLAGYDLQQTKDYYQSIVSRAWTEAQSLGDLKLRTEAVDRNLDWMILDPNAYRRMDTWHRAGWYYWNPWFSGGSRPATTTAGPGGLSLPGSAGGGPPPLPSTPTAGDVAGAFGGRLEGLSGSFASALGLGHATGVFSGVDKVTGQAFKTFLTEAQKSSSGSGRSGGGFSCACACAGCACACACAGGGR